MISRLGILATELMTAVGPLRSVPWYGEQPSASGSPALRPSAEAPTHRPLGTLAEMVAVQGMFRQPIGPRPWRAVRYFSSSRMKIMYTSWASRSTSSWSLPNLGALFSSSCRICSPSRPAKSESSASASRAPVSTPRSNTSSRMAARELAALVTPVSGPVTRS